MIQPNKGALYPKSLTHGNITNIFTNVFLLETYLKFMLFFTFVGESCDQKLYLQP